MGTLDSAIAATTAAEKTYNADVAEVTTIQASIAQAAAPLAPAWAQLAADATNFNQSLDNLSAACLAAKVTVPPLTPTPSLPTLPIPPPQSS